MEYSITLVPDVFAKKISTDIVLKELFANMNHSCYIAMFLSMFESIYGENEENDEKVQRLKYIHKKIKISENIQHTWLRLFEETLEELQLDNTQDIMKKMKYMCLQIFEDVDIETNENEADHCCVHRSSLQSIKDKYKAKQNISKDLDTLLARAKKSVL